METLRALHSLLSEKRLKRIELINNEKKGRQASLPIRFYQILENQDIKTDEQVAQQLFGKTVDGQYRMLKMRTKRMMFNSLFFLDLDESTNSRKVRKLVKCNRNLHAIKILMYSGHLKAGQDLAKKTLKVCLRYELWDEALPLLKFLTIISSHDLDLKNFQYYKELINTVSQFQFVEQKTNNALLELEIATRSPNTKPYVVAKLAESLTVKMEKIYKRYPHFSNALAYLKIKKHGCTLQDKYEEADQVLREIEKLFKRLPEFVSPAHWCDLYMNRAYNCLYLGEYNIGISYSRLATRNIANSTPMWFLSARMYFLLLMYSKEYHRALNISIEVLSNPEFTNQVGHLQEEWKIYRGYEFFACHAFLKLNDDKETFRINKLLNELHFYSAHKEGLNVALLILEVLIFFLYRDYPSIIDRIEGLKKYKERNLKIKETTRCRIFIDLIEIAVKNSFRQNETQEAAKEKLKLLQAAKLGPEGNIENLEIIPYDRLWQWIVSKLD